MSEELSRYYAVINWIAGKTYSNDAGSREAQVVRGASSLVMGAVGGSCFGDWGGEI